MKDTIRKDDFNPIWSALRLPGSGWVSELLTGHLARSNRITPRSRRNLKVTKGRAADSRRTTCQGRSQRPELCACCAAANCS